MWGRKKKKIPDKAEKLGELCKAIQENSPFQFVIMTIADEDGEIFQAAYWSREEFLDEFCPKLFSGFRGVIDLNLNKGTPGTLH